MSIHESTCKGCTYITHNPQVCSSCIFFHSSAVVIMVTQKLFLFIIEGLDGETTLVKNFNFEENVPEVHYRSGQHLFHRFSWNLQDILLVSLTNHTAFHGNRWNRLSTAMVNFRNIFLKIKIFDWDCFSTSPSIDVNISVMYNWVP